MTPIRHTLRIPAPHTHYVEVESAFPVESGSPLTVMMAVWTPGSYLVREYARHIEQMTASTPDDHAVSVEKVRKNRWRVAAQGATEVLIRYRLYCREMSVRTNWVEHGFALLNGAPTFLTIPHDPHRPHEIRLILPDHWSQSCTALPSAGAPHTYLAADYDTLVDSPILLGNPAVYSFEVDGVPHQLVNQGEGSAWDGPRSVADVRAIVSTQARFWGSLPYARYVILNVLSESGGGLEHRDSTVLMGSRWATRTRASYVGSATQGGWLSLVSHELFHAWNGKRLRPAALGPFDYENEIYTGSLWIVEGTTSYYDALLLCRAGLCSNDEYFALLSRALDQLRNQPGRAVQSLASSSYDAWIKHYRPDENSSNSSVSYYVKGAVVAFLLDAHIRRLTNDARSLDDVMRLAYQHYSGERGFTEEEFRRIAQDIAGADLTQWFHRAIDSTEELDYSEALDWYGLRFAAAPEGDPKPWLGITTRRENGRLVVSRVTRDSPASRAGLNVEDELIGLNGYRIRPDQWDRRLEDLRPGDLASLLVARRDELLRMDAVFAAEPSPTLRLESDPDGDAVQWSHLLAWLESDLPARSSAGSALV